MGHILFGDHDLLLAKLKKTGVGFFSQAHILASKDVSSLLVHQRSHLTTTSRRFFSQTHVLASKDVSSLFGSSS